MKLKDLEKLRPGDFINHKHYGLCIVDVFQLDGRGDYFGLAVRPLTNTGYNTLATWSGVLFNRTLEDSKRLILGKVENPIIPKLIFKTNNGFDVHDWIIPGEVTDEGKFSSVKLREFPTLSQALVFAGEFATREEALMAMAKNGITE